MVLRFKSKVGTWLGVFAIIVIFLGCQGSKQDPEPTPHPIVGEWFRDSYELEIVVHSGKSLVEFYSDLGFNDVEAASRADSLVTSFESNSVLTLDLKNDSTYRLTTFNLIAQGPWILSEDEKFFTIPQPVVIEGITLIASVEKLTDMELEFSITNIDWPEAGLTVRESYAFVKE